MGKGQMRKEAPSAWEPARGVPKQPQLTEEPCRRVQLGQTTAFRGAEQIRETEPLGNISTETPPSSQVNLIAPESQKLKVECISSHQLLEWCDTKKFN